MTDEFIQLDGCNPSLSIAQVVDQISLYQFVFLTMTDRNRQSQPAIYPIDYAFADLVQDMVMNGWPPENLTKARGGRPLLSPGSHQLPPQ